MEKDVSRRDFLKFVGAAGAVAFLSACEKSLAPLATLTQPVMPTRTSTEASTATPSLTPTETATQTLMPTETEHLTTPKIMLLGDSMISLGRVPTYLSEDLTAVGLKAEFVGDKLTGTNTVPAEGHGGFNTVQMAQELVQEGAWRELNGTEIPNNFTKHIPDIVIIQLGTNDAINASEYGSNPIPVYKDYMGQIVDYLRSKNPSVKIIIPTLIPSQVKDYDAKIIMLNAIIPGFAASLDTKDSRVITTQDLRNDWRFDDFNDIVHPNTKGQKKIAQAYFDALVGNKYFTEALSK